MNLIKTTLRTVDNKTEIMIGEAGPFKTSKTGVALEKEREKGDEFNSDNIEWLNA